jgi:anthranilate 1,2-dioxygenase small subunit
LSEGVPAERRLVLEDFLTAYAHCIDDDALEQWPDFFTDDGVYQIISREGHEHGHKIGVMLCRGQGMMRDRVRAMRQANIYEPQRYTHILSRPAFTNDGDVVAGRTNFHVVRTMEDGQSGLFATGCYVDEIVSGLEGPRLRCRKVVIDSRRIDTLLVVPL